MSKKHTDVLKSKIGEVPALTGRVFTTIATHGTVAPYVVVHPAPGANSQERVTGPYTAKHPRFTLHVVGETADQVQVLGDLLEQKLFPAGRGVVLPVTGERSFPLWFEAPLPIQVSTDPLPEVIYLVIECGWTTEPE